MEDSRLISPIYWYWHKNAKVVISLRHKLPQGIGENILRYCGCSFHGWDYNVLFLGSLNRLAKDNKLFANFIKYGTNKYKKVVNITRNMAEIKDIQSSMSKRDRIFKKLRIKIMRNLDVINEEIAIALKNKKSNGKCVRMTTIWEKIPRDYIGCVEVGTMNVWPDQQSDSSSLIPVNNINFNIN
jgi:hypothetical protein